MIYINGKFLCQKTTGVQRFAYELTKGLLELRQKEIKILVPKSVDLYKSLDNIERVGKAKNLFFWEQFILPRYLNKKNDLLLNFTGLGPIFYANKIITIHDISFLINPKWFSKKYYLTYRYLTPLSTRKSRCVFTVSYFSKKEIEKKFHINPCKIHVIYNAYSKVSSIIKYNHSNYILSVATLDPRKNLQTLIKSMKSVDLNVKLKIVGTDNEKVFSSNKIMLNDIDSRIEFLGYVNDHELTYLYENALLFVYPSLYEGFGLPVIEAMANGCATVISDIQSLKEISLDASLYFDPLDQKDISNKINMVLKSEELKQSLINKGFENVKRFNWSQSANNVIEIIENIDNAESNTYI